MNPTVKTILAVIAGLIVGNVINMGLLLIGIQIIPPPEGINFMDPNSIAENMHLFEFKHFITPFLAHAVGTLAGAYTAARIVGNKHIQIGLIIGAFFLLFGIINMMSIAAPLAFNVTDLLLSYLPMGWLGGRLAAGGTK